MIADGSGRNDHEDRDEDGQRLGPHCRCLLRQWRLGSGTRSGPPAISWPPPVVKGRRGSSRCRNLCAFFCSCGGLLLVSGKLPAETRFWGDPISTPPRVSSGRARRARWAGSQVTVVFAVAAAQIIRSPPAPVSVAVGPEFVLGISRQDLDAAASGQDGQGNQDEGRQPCVNLSYSLLRPPN